MHILWFTLNTSNMSIIKPILYNQNEAIQIFNPQFKAPKINDDSSNTKSAFSFNLWAHNPKHLMNQKNYMWKLSCVLAPPNQGILFIFSIAHIIDEKIIVHSSRYIWLHHHLIQYAQKKSSSSIVITSIGGAITIKRTKKELRRVLKIVKIGEIFMFYHLKPW